MTLLDIVAAAIYSIYHLDLHYIGNNPSDGPWILPSFCTGRFYV